MKTIEQRKAEALEDLSSWVDIDCSKARIQTKMILNNKTLKTIEELLAPTPTGDEVAEAINLLNADSSKYVVKPKRIFVIGWTTSGYITDEDNSPQFIAKVEPESSNWYTLTELDTDGMTSIFDSIKSLTVSLNKRELRPASFLEASKILSECHKERS